MNKLSLTLSASDQEVPNRCGDKRPKDAEGYVGGLDCTDASE